MTCAYADIVGRSHNSPMARRKSQMRDPHPHLSGRCYLAAATRAHPFPTLGSGVPACTLLHPHTHVAVTVSQIEVLGSCAGRRSERGQARMAAGGGGRVEGREERRGEERRRPTGWSKEYEAGRSVSANIQMREGDLVKGWGVGGTAAPGGGGCASAGQSPASQARSVVQFGRGVK